MKDEFCSEHVMTAQEVSSYLKIPLSSIYALTKQGQLAGVKVGKHWRYLEKDIHAYLRGAFNLNSKSDIFSGQEKRDRRAHPRINCEIKAKVRVMLHRKSQVRGGAVIYNLSEDGMLISFDAHENQGGNLDLGDPLKAVFEIPSTDVRIETIGRVIRSARANEDSYGVKFRNLTPESRGAIASYVG